MKKLSTFAYFGVALCLVLPGCSKKDNGGSTSTGTGPAVDLKLKWTVGKKYLEHMEMNQDNKMNAAGRPMEQTMTMGSDYSISAQKELPGGGCQLDMEFVGQKIQSAMGGQTMASFDSSTDPANDGKNPIAPMFRKIIGLHVQYETDASGHVQKVDGVDELVERMGGNTPQGAMVKSMLNEQTLKQYADFGRGLPDHPVRTGDTWPMNVEIPMGQIGTLVINLTYTFTGWDDHDGRKCAKLDYSGTVKSKPGAAPATFALDSGKMTGTTWFDSDAGVVVENTSTQNMNMKVTPTPNQVINSVIAQTTDLKLTDVVDIK